MIVDEIIKQLKTIIEELEVLDEFLIQFAEKTEEEAEEVVEEDIEASEEDEGLEPLSRHKRKSITDIFKEKME